MHTTLADVPPTRSYLSPYLGQDQDLRVATIKTWHGALGEGSPEQKHPELRKFGRPEGSRNLWQVKHSSLYGKLVSQDTKGSQLPMMTGNPPKREVAEPAPPRPPRMGSSLWSMLVCCRLGTPRSSRTKDTPGRWLYNKFKFQVDSVEQLRLSLQTSFPTGDCVPAPQQVKYGLQAGGRGSKTDPTREGLSTTRTLWLAGHGRAWGHCSQPSFPMVDKNVLAVYAGSHRRQRL